VVPLIDTAKSLDRCEEIALAAPRRVPTLIWGLGDFSVDRRSRLLDVLRHTPDATELLRARSHVAVVAPAVGMRAALDGPYFDLQNSDVLVEDTAW
jgi:citrate lyase beta subunit